jgi:hypothetical protein
MNIASDENEQLKKERVNSTTNKNRKEEITQRFLMQLLNINLYLIY